MKNYIFKGQSHSDFTNEYMLTLGMSAEQIESVLNQKEFELSQNVDKRQAAYKAESDDFFLEAIRKDAEGDAEGAALARENGLKIAAEIKTRYPLVEA